MNKLKKLFQNAASNTRQKADKHKRFSAISQAQAHKHKCLHVASHSRFDKDESRHPSRPRRILAVASTGLALVAVVVVSLTGLNSPAHAVDSSAILRKVLEANLETCYSDTYMKSEIVAAQYKGPRSLLTGGGLGNKVVLLPNNVGNSAKNSAITCAQLFDGADDMPGLVSLAGKGDPSLENMGFEATGSNPNYQARCSSFEYTYYGDNRQPMTGHTNQICATVNDDAIVYSTGQTPFYAKGEANGPVSIRYSADGAGIIEFIRDGRRIGSFSTVGIAKWSRLETKMNNQKGKSMGGNDNQAVTISDVIPSAPTTTTQADKVHRIANAKQRALRFFTGNDQATFASTRLTEGELYSLYIDYVNQVARNNSNFVYGQCYATKDEAAQGGNYAVPSGEQWCRVDSDVVRSVSGSFNIVSDRNSGRLKGQLFPAVLNGLMNLDYDAIRNEGVTIGTIGESGVINGGVADDTSTADGDGAQEGVEPCYSAAASLGWIVCPVIQGVGNAVSGIYDQIVAPFLTIDASLLSSGDGSTSTYSGWKIFRDFANIVFVIMFLIVILAQVTGIGISNYNIKKILPRLIVVAVLVNLSFVICQLAVDLSNIIGSGSEQLLANMANQVNPDGEIGYELDDIVNSILATVLTVGGATAGVIFAASLFPIWILPLLLVLLACLIGVLLFFVTLGVRQAGIIILVVIAPLAIVCYALPNTKKLFDRWRKMFIGLLLVYPICGLLMGGAKFASALLVSAGLSTGTSGGEGSATLTLGGSGFIYMLIAMLVSVIPFFFIPGLVRSSMAAMGNLGAKITGFGDRLSGLANRGIRNSTRFREHQADARQEYERRVRAGRDSRIVGSADSVLRRLDAKRTNRENPNDLSGLNARERRLYQQAAYRKARAMGRSDRTEAEDMQNLVNSQRTALAAGGLRRQALQDTLANEAREKEISELDNALTNGNLDGIDANNLGAIDSNGNLVTVDKEGNAIAGVERSLAAALLNYQKRINENPDDQVARAKMQVIARRLMAAGDKGQTNVTNSLRGQAFDANGNSTRTEALKRTSEAIARNGQWMGKIKDSDNGAWRLISDAANGSATLGNRASYNAVGDDKLSSALIPDLSDGFFDSVESAIGAGDYNDAEGMARLEAMDKAFQEAMADPRVSARIKADKQRRINEIRQAIYDHKARQWAAQNGVPVPPSEGLSREQQQQALDNLRSAYGEVNGRFRPLRAGQEFRVPRTASPVPQGFTEAGIWTGGGNGPTQQQQIAYEEWAREKAAVDRYNAQIDSENNS